MAELDTPLWLNWLAALSVAGGGVVYLARLILLPGVKKQVEDMLRDKFLEAKLEMEKRHRENKLELDRLGRILADTQNDRKKLREQLAQVAEELAYLRGKSSGTFKRPQ